MSESINGTKSKSMGGGDGGSGSSSSSTTTAVAETGVDGTSPNSELEITTEEKSNLHEKELAEAALNDFMNKDYEKCSMNLHLLSMSSSPAISKDHRIQHNSYIGNFYHTKLEHCNNLFNKLRAIYSDDYESDAFHIKDQTHYIGYFNIAILLYHQRQPKSALKILLKIMENTLHLDELLCQRAGLLTINLLLNTNQPKKANIIIDLMCKHLANSLEFINDDDDLDDDSMTAILLDEQNSPINSSSSSGGGGGGGISSSNNKLLKSSSFALLDDFKSMFKLYKYRTLVLLNEKCTIPNIDSSQMCVLRGHQYYLGHDYQMAAKEITKEFINPLSDIRINGEDYHVVIGNNMGLVHFHVKHYAMATHFLQNALTADQRAADNTANCTPLQCVGATKRPEILYNLGIALLHLQRPKEAFECLLVPLNSYHNNPRLWLRLAEACIMVHEQELNAKQNPFIVSSVISSGLHRKYVLQPDPVKYLSDDSQLFGIPSTNLEFASFCLRNALALIRSYETNWVDETNKSGTPAESAATAANDWTKIKENSECNPSKPLTKITFDKLKCAVLTAYSYVQLRLGEYTLALKYAKDLLQLPYLPDAYATLGRLYAAEALLMLDRLPDTFFFITPDFIGNLKEDDFIHTGGSSDWEIDSLDKIQSILKYNLAVLHAIFGDHAESQKMLVDCKHKIVFPYINKLRMYLNLHMNNIEKCKRLIRTDTPQYFKHFPYY